MAPISARIVFDARSSNGKVQLWLRHLDSSSAQPMRGTDDEYLPFWFSDGQYIGFAVGPGVAERGDALEVGKVR